MPLLVGVDGVEKMSKSLGNQIGVTDEPREIYGRTMDPRLGARRSGTSCCSGGPLARGRRPARGQARAGARADRDLRIAPRPPTPRPPNGIACRSAAAPERGPGGDVSPSDGGSSTCRR